jgi:hypothetical protein
MTKNLRDMTNVELHDASYEAQRRAGGDWSNPRVAALRAEIYRRGAEARTLREVSR